ncbi:hypothetical protein CCR80_09775 [Rhodothalassium salexigens]|uniref:SDR family NAD(P)-dependent oxidoreductase n=1 Tax=Rhodothalassium salexigens TaxID=1086 RepID=UPI001912AA65|nr:SDR family NAD(P)-dependent oxidoreductase [Rhodothalassium salexigens]MBK5921316.1 hypothetical protein [Rhodothalassium salexigens]
MTRVEGPVWIVGASTGMGRSVALKLARAGVPVAISARSADKLQAVADEAGPKAARIVPVPLDATDEAAVAAALDQVEQALGPVATLIYGAGFWKLAPADTLTVKLFRDHFEVNFFAALTVALAAFGRMRTRGRGRIMLISSVAGYTGLPGAAAYGASKAAMTHVAESLHPEAGRDGVLVQVASPGFVDTPMTASNPFPMPFIISADKAADRIIAGLKTRRFEISFPRRFTLLLKLLRCLPYPLYFALMRPPARADDAAQPTGAGASTSDSARR